MVIAALLAVGEIAVGVTLKTRLSGVGPFNITTYSWVLAAYMMLIRKSLRFGDWPWHDFLRLQVLCKSVSELEAVTGFDAQLILARVVHEESINRLTTRGPYNCVFSRRSDAADGFSIVKAMNLNTVLLCGFIMV